MNVLRRTWNQLPEDVRRGVGLRNLRQSVASRRVIARHNARLPAGAPTLNFFPERPIPRAQLVTILALLGVRKRAMTAGRWSLKAWTSAHVYLGLALVVIATLHTGFQLGWNVHTLAYALMLLVIASGVYGTAVYALLPAKLSGNRREMTQAQMVEALAALDRQLEAAAQPLGRADADVVIVALRQDPFGYGLIARLTGLYRGCRTERAIEALYRKAASDPAIERVAGLLGKRQAQLEQIRRHIRLKALLEVWLYVHVPLTVMLLAALTAHIVSVFYYW